MDKRMIILPAIDIKDGRCVRLYQGDYAQVTTYDTDPVQVALRWQDAGASWLHIVDLDGAAQGSPANADLIGRICETTTLSIEVGGGMRSLAHIEQMFGLGVNRVILGTVAITDRALLQDALARWGQQIVVGLDARDGWVAISG
ncbi:MAG TPA: HisA/HisF-related TIM barrel protein, partial [Ktedonobacteraceae bacterium]